MAYKGGWGTRSLEHIDQQSGPSILNSNPSLSPSAGNELTMHFSTTGLLTLLAMAMSVAASPVANANAPTLFSRDCVSDIPEQAYSSDLPPSSWRPVNDLFLADVCDEAVARRR